MTFQSLINALSIPRGALVDQRVPKKLLVEQGAPTAADKRRITEGIEEIHWIAALKPTNIGVPTFKDATREYLEVSVLTAALRPSANAARLIELIHRAVPYPLFLISEQRGSFTLSVAHKRWSQGEGGKVVVEVVRQVSLSPNESMSQEEAFLETIALERLPSRDLFSLYTGWHERMAALEAARITGNFALPQSVEKAAAMKHGLDEHVRIKRELAILKAKAHKEKQINRQVELNIEIKRLEAELSATEKAL